MDLESLKCSIEEETGIPVGLRYKVVYWGKQVEQPNDTTKVRAIHLEINTKNFNTNFQKLIVVYGRSKLGFKNKRRMRLWAHLNLAKSDKAKGTLIKAYER